MLSSKGVAPSRRHLAVVSRRQMESFAQMEHECVTSAHFIIYRLDFEQIARKACCCFARHLFSNKLSALHQQPDSEFSSEIIKRRIKHMELANEFFQPAPSTALAQHSSYAPWFMFMAFRDCSLSWSRKPTHSMEHGETAWWPHSEQRRCGWALSFQNF